jgi:hypothetical protein
MEAIEIVAELSSELKNSEDSEVLEFTHNFRSTTRR